MSRSNRSFGHVEALEKRELLFASAFIDNGSLIINADPWGGEVDAQRFFGNSVLVTSPNRAQAFSGNAVNRIVFNGSEFADNFENHTSIPSRIHGNGGWDTLTGGDGNDQIFGNRGNDTIHAGLGNDVIAGGQGNDLLSGGRGNDRYLFDIDGPLGRDTLDEGTGLTGLAGGSDTLDFSLGRTGINIDLEQATWQTVHPNLTLALGARFTFENVVGTSGNDTLRGNALANRLEGRLGDDSLFGRSGDDEVYGCEGNDTVFAGLGNDKLGGGRGNDQLWGGAGNDTYLFDIDKPLGRDTLNEGSGLAGLQGGRDTLDFSLGSSGINLDLDRWIEQAVHPNLTLELVASYTFENVMGTSGNDTIRGNSASNRFVGGQGNDSLFGRGGNDTYVFDADGALGADTVEDWSGTDTLDFSPTTQKAVSCELRVGWQQVNANLRLQLNSLIDNVVGGSRNDTLVGNDLRNNISGGAGNDTIRGGQGNDVLHGQSGTDRIFGGPGNDNLYGGGGNFDELYGESGNDGLFGGAGMADFLFGGPGSDRLLVHWTGWDLTPDVMREDAVLYFRDGNATHAAERDWAAGAFTDAEIERIDRALAELHHATANARLLETHSGGSITFVRQGAPNEPTTTEGWNAASSIHLVPASFSSDNWLHQVVFHEVGHNWDQSHENASVGQFRAISGWRQLPSGMGIWSSGIPYRQAGDESTWWYDDRSDFARDYGRRNPFEDFATSFAAYFMDREGRPYSEAPGPAGIPNKMEYMESFVAGLA